MTVILDDSVDDMGTDLDSITVSDNDMKLAAEAIRDAYRRPELNSVVRYGMGIRLDDYFDTKQGFKFVVDELVDWAASEGKFLDLLALAFHEKPGNPALAREAQRLGISAPRHLRRFDHAAEPPEAPDSLEALVERKSRLTTVREFQERFAALTARVCRIDTGFRRGTGFLVGPDLALTNYHVMQEVIAQSEAARQHVQFRFDDIADGNSQSQACCGLAETWRLASSPYSASDLTGEGEPGPGELDYVLLRLDARIGEAAPPGGERERGWFRLQPKSGPIMARHDVTLVVQHPRSRPMEAAWGIIVDFAGSGRRVRYNVTTDEGSSGSPCLTADLVPFALHHAADPAQHPRYNQGIPLALIAADAQQQAGTLE